MGSVSLSNSASARAALHHAARQSWQCVAMAAGGSWGFSPGYNHGKHGINIHSKWWWARQSLYKIIGFFQ